MISIKNDSKLLMMSMISNDSTGHCSEGYWKEYGGFNNIDCNYYSEVNSAGSDIFPANRLRRTDKSKLSTKKEKDNSKERPEY